MRRGALLLVLLLGGCALEEDPAATIRAADIRRHQLFLAADALEGREAGSEGAHRAAVYLADEAERLGLRPGGTDGWFQPFGAGMKNVIALVPGTDPARASEYVLLGAHYDHVGRDWEGRNRGTPGEIHNGADDNASGVSVLLDVAEAVVRRPFRRTAAFVWFDGEERGLLGSRHWVEHPTLPLEGCVAMINCDMVGRNETRQIFAVVDRDERGAPRFPRWAAVLEEAERRLRLRLDWTGADALRERSDHWPFMQKGIPAVFLTGGLHEDYHTERDDIEKINFPKQELVGRLVYFVLARAAGGAEKFR